MSQVNICPNEMGVPPALPGRQSNFENSGSIPPAVAFVFAEARCLASLVPLQLLLLFTGCDQAPLRGLIATGEKQKQLQRHEARQATGFGKNEGTSGRYTPGILKV